MICLLAICIVLTFKIFSWLVVEDDIIESYDYYFNYMQNFHYSNYCSPNKLVGHMNIRKVVNVSKSLFQGSTVQVDPKIETVQIHLSNK